MTDIPLDNETVLRPIRFTKHYGIVRDKNGKIKIDNIKDIPLGIWAVMTDEERKEIQAKGGYKEGDKQ